MQTFLVVIISALIAAACCLAVAYGCFRKAFYLKRKKPYQNNPKQYPLPKGALYEPYHPAMRGWHDAAREREYTEHFIKSYDGLTLYARYYEIDKTAPIEIMFHGYKSSAERDLIGGMFRCFAQGRNVLLVSQRCSGKSHGRVITFGIKEHRDCVAWVEYVVKNISPNGKIILSGISMGGATVLMAAAQTMPSNVIAVIADCAYTTPKDIIKKVIKSEMHLPPNLCYPFVKLGAFVFGGFNLDKFSPLEAMKHCKIPVLFFHGDADSFVPCQMSIDNYNACAAPKKRLAVVKGAEHGLCYAVDPELYLDEIYEFLGDML